MSVKAKKDAVVKGVSALWDLAKKEGADLADDAASRMARAAEQGYDTSKVVYHGTQSDVPAFDMEKVRERFPQSIGIHLTDQPASEASIYADGLKNYMAGWNPSARNAEDVAEGANVMPLLVKTENPLVIDTDQLTASMEADLNRGVIIEKLVSAKRAGTPYDSVVINSPNGQNIIKLDNTGIRSVNAAFDPAKKDSANLLAGLGGAAVLGGSLAPEDAEAGVGAATTTALAPEMYRQMEETRRVVSDFAQRRAPKASFWKQKRDELLELAGAGVAAATSGYETLQDKGFIPQGTPFADFFSQRSADSQEPVRAVSALAALVATQDPQKAAGVYRMPQEQIADEAGGLVTDYLAQAGYPGIAPAAGTAVNVGINMAGF